MRREVLQREKSGRAGDKILGKPVNHSLTETESQCSDVCDIHEEF